MIFKDTSKHGFPGQDKMGLLNIEKNAKQLGYDVAAKKYGLKPPTINLMKEIESDTKKFHKAFKEYKKLSKEHKWFGKTEKNLSLYKAYTTYFDAMVSMHRNRKKLQAIMWNHKNNKATYGKKYQGKYKLPEFKLKKLTYSAFLGSEKGYRAGRVGKSTLGWLADKADFLYEGTKEEWLGEEGVFKKIGKIGTEDY